MSWDEWVDVQMEARPIHVGSGLDGPSHGIFQRAFGIPPSAIDAWCTDVPSAASAPYPRPKAPAAS
eukprot:scaffold4408_cov143-Isochrysis_galbana.AAC.5